MEPINKLREKWKTKNGKTVSLSAQHNELYIITHADNSFHTVRSNEQLMLKKYPPID